MADPAVVVRDLSFRYRPDLPLVLCGADLEVPRAARCLVVGANGAGKTTLLRIIGGKHMVAREAVRVLGRSAFHDTDLAASVDYLGGNFPFAVDIRVGELVERVQPVAPERRARLIELLGVDTGWHMHRVSDGQRRRVQLLLGLMRLRELLLLDEVTTDLDLLARQDLLDFLRDESERRGVTVLYASHILDRLETWATHVCMVSGGRVERMVPLDQMAELVQARAAGASSPLYQAVHGWLAAQRAPRASGGPPLL
ncbi:MAG TPA: ATP-binding cassette domain-containing protein [Kofleriaceae bacterium]|nr:ATP-binding cassette domain-containing protein [Kofleriaceae bacterium]